MTISDNNPKNMARLARLTITRLLSCLSLLAAEESITLRCIGSHLSALMIGLDRRHLFFAGL